MTLSVHDRADVARLLAVAAAVFHSDPAPDAVVRAVAAADAAPERARVSAAAWRHFKKRAGRLGNEIRGYRNMLAATGRRRTERPGLPFLSRYTPQVLDCHGEVGLFWACPGEGQASLLKFSCPVPLGALDAARSQVTLDSGFAAAWRHVLSRPPQAPERSGLPAHAFAWPRGRVIYVPLRGRKPFLVAAAPEIVADRSLAPRIARAFLLPDGLWELRADTALSGAPAPRGP